MRSVLVFGLLTALCASADAATVHRFKRPEAHLRPAQRVTVPKGFAVPGWTDEETWKWLHDGSAASGLF
jgi:hypothetical protein